MDLSAEWTFDAVLGSRVADGAGARYGADQSVEPGYKLNPLGAPVELSQALALGGENVWMPAGRPPLSGVAVR